MRIAHLADLHMSKEHAGEALTSLRCCTEQIKANPVSMVVIAGDIWDASMLNVEASGFNRFVDALRDIAEVAPVAMIYGTPSHDTDGSLAVFEKIACRHSITILYPGRVYFKHGTVIDEESQGAECVLFGIPEPRKKYLLAEETAGKGAAEAAVRDALSRLCVGLGARRREYPGLPCVCVYHGEVAGSVLQNARTVERGTGVAITVDDLAAVGADYYALGHIHAPQQVGALPAYYAGSIYPKTWGETHQAGFNIVKLTPEGNAAGLPEYTAAVTRVAFPHPQNLKIEAELSEVSGLPALPEAVQGKKVWVELVSKRGNGAQYKRDKLLRQLLEQGAVAGSRVTLNEAALETVRAAGIVAVHTPMAKFAVWAENTAVVRTENLEKKIGALAAEITQATPQAGGEWELVRVRLRGATGIWKGTGKDEVAVNFDAFDEGLIALVGGNGAGKTTLLENSQPYPCLFTRRGKLQDRFRLRDSWREVVYRNHTTGAYVKLVIQIDGLTKGASKYFAYTAPACQQDNVDLWAWSPVAGVDGNLKPYEDFVNETFGPLELFLRTAFAAQRAGKHQPELLDATAGEKKALFAALAGVDYLQAFADRALERQKAETEQVQDAEVTARVMEAAVGRKGAETERLAEAEAALSTARRKLREVTEASAAAEAALERIRAAWEAERLRLQRVEVAQTALAATGAEITTLEAAVAGYEAAAQARTTHEKALAEYEDLRKLVATEQEQRQQNLQENLQRERKYMVEKQEFDQRIRLLEKDKRACEMALATTERDIERLRAEIVLYERDAREITEVCPTCGQELPQAKLAEFAAKRAEFCGKISDRQAKIAGLVGQGATLRQEAGRLTDTIAGVAFAAPQPEPPVAFDASALTAATARLAKLDGERVRVLLVQATEAETRIAGLREQIAARTVAYEKTVLDLAGLEDGAEAGAKLEQDLSAAAERRAVLVEEYAAEAGAVARAEAEGAAARKALAEIAEQEATLAGVEARLHAARREAAEWDTLVRAFGKDGIQALELDALAPGIAASANRILQSAYGDRFKVEIRTTRIGGQGKRAKQIEDFLIYVYDEDGEESLLEDKSGGEVVWIKRALYDAFAVVRRRNTGFAFRTCFQDEADGALDGAAKTAYMAMIAASHRESGLRHTLVISHSQEVLTAIDQKITMEAL